MNPTRPPQTGFTLIEAVVVIVITGIVAGMVAVFIKTSIDSYMASVRRAGLTDAADVTLRRLGRDIRLALPNSLRVADSSGNTGTCNAAATTCFIEFIPTSAGGLYRAAGDGSTGGTILDFTNTADTSFDVLGPLPSPLASGASGDYIAVYNLGPGFNPANAYMGNSALCTTSGTGCNLAQVSKLVGNTIFLSANPFAYETPPLPSPNNRFQVVPNSGPVTYSCSPSTTVAAAINRYTGYTFLATQPTAFSPSITPALVESNATCTVDYSPTALGRDGILFVSITVNDTASGENVTVFREIHVDNAP